METTRPEPIPKLELAMRIAQMGGPDAVEVLTWENAYTFHRGGSLEDLRWCLIGGTLYADYMAIHDPYFDVYDIRRRWPCRD